MSRIMYLTGVVAFVDDLLLSKLEQELRPLLHGGQGCRTSSASRFPKASLTAARQMCEGSWRETSKRASLAQRTSLPGEEDALERDDPSVAPCISAIFEEADRSVSAPTQMIVVLSSRGEGGKEWEGWGEPPTPCCDFVSSGGLMFCVKNA